MKELKLFNEHEFKHALELMHLAGLDTRISIGIKKLLMIIEMARQDVDKAEKFVEALKDESIKHGANVVANNVLGRAG